MSTRTRWIVSPTIHRTTHPTTGATTLHYDAVMVTHPDAFILPSEVDRAGRAGRRALGPADGRRTVVTPVYAHRADGRRSTSVAYVVVYRA